MPVAAHWVFLGGGTLAMLVACFAAWRRERGITDARKSYLQLTRISHEGKKLLAAYDAIPPGGAREAIDAVSNLIPWHRDTLKAMEDSYSAHWDHFKDIGAFESRGEEASRGQAETLLKRIDDLIGILKPVASV